MPMNLVFLQCDCTHEYNVLFHIMGHKVDRDEEYMWAIMAEYIQTNADGINVVVGDYLQWKGQTLDDYVEFIKVQGHKGNELCVPFGLHDKLQGHRHDKNWILVHC